MKQPLNIHLSANEQQNIRIIKQRPAFCAYHVPYAVCDIIPLPDVSIVRQQSRNNDFHMQLLDINASSDVCLRFSINEPTAFGFFMLKGESIFYDANELRISRVQQNTYHFCYNGIATYDTLLRKGLNTMLVVAIRREWMMAEEKNLPEFRPLITHLTNGVQERVILPNRRIGKIINRYLGRILYYTALNAAERGSGIFHLMVKGMVFYHGTLKKGSHLLAQNHPGDEERLCDFLAQYYATERVMKREGMARELGMSEWTIKLLVGKLFGKSLHQHIIERRMSKAAELLDTTEMRVKEIALSVGYDNEAYFSTAFSHYFHISPSTYRKSSHI